MRQFGLIGYPLGHSFSKRYFTEKFQELGLNDHVYETYPIESIEGFKSLVDSHSNLIGLNVTIPHKEAVIPFLDFKSPVVKAIGACNCIHIKEGKLWGYNTDVIGFHRSLQSSFPDLPGKALILGTGGASKAVRYVLETLNISFQFVSRKKTDSTLSYENLDAELIREYRLIINTTPLGMQPAISEAPPIPYEFIGDGHCLFDLIYNPATTVFLEKGRKRGAQIQNGLDMLVIQAEESWKIWNAG
jgi:shikimate dehydrogenase